MCVTPREDKKNEIKSDKKYSKRKQEIDREKLANKGSEASKEILK